MGSEAITSLDEVFDKFLKNKDRIFRNREVLSHNYVPKKLFHREEQYHNLLNAMIDGYREGNSFILCYGKAGTGKTSLVKSIINRITSKCKQLGVSDIIATFLNCRQTTTKYGILSKIVHESGLSVPKKYNFNKLFQHFKNKIDIKTHFIVIILDEIDKLVSKSVKKNNNFSNLLERMTKDLKNAKICIIGLSNDLNFEDHISEQLLTSLKIKLVNFDPYNSKELEYILNERATCGFYPGIVSEKELKIIADLAAKTGGDARYALCLLLQAGETIERNSESIITESCITKIHNILKNKSLGYCEFI